MIIIKRNYQQENLNEKYVDTKTIIVEYLCLL
jgi:hypothetical protein